MMSIQLTENTSTDLLRKMTEHPTTINGEVDLDVWMDKVYYDKNSGLAWKYVPGVGRNARIARLHIYKPGAARILGNPGFKITEYLASEDLSEVKEINTQFFHDATEAKQAWWKLTGLKSKMESKYKITFDNFKKIIF